MLEGEVTTERNSIDTDKVDLGVIGKHRIRAESHISVELINHNTGFAADLKSTVVIVINGTGFESSIGNADNTGSIDENGTADLKLGTRFNIESTLMCIGDREIISIVRITDMEIVINNQRTFFSSHIYSGSGHTILNIAISLLGHTAFDCHICVSKTQMCICHLCNIDGKIFINNNLPQFKASFGIDIDCTGSCQLCSKTIINAATQDVQLGTGFSIFADIQGTIDSNINIFHPVTIRFIGFIVIKSFNINYISCFFTECNTALSAYAPSLV